MSTSTLADAVRDLVSRMAWMVDRLRPRRCDREACREDLAARAVGSGGKGGG